MRLPKRLCLTVPHENIYEGRFSNEATENYFCERAFSFFSVPSSLLFSSSTARASGDMPTLVSLAWVRCGGGVLVGRVGMGWR